MVNWPEYMRFRDQFARVLDPVFYTIEWLDGEVACERILLFNTENSAILFSIKTYPTGAKELHGMAAVGELQAIVSDLIPSAEKFGKQNGCIVAVIESRPGWSKMLSDYEVHQIVIRKAL